MDIKREVVIDKFLESHNMDYLFCILAEKEANRLSFLPDPVKKSFDEKITTMALKHTALNDVPDYIIEEYIDPTETDDEDMEYEEEYVDDTYRQHEIESPFTNTPIDDDDDDIDD